MSKSVAPDDRSDNGGADPLTATSGKRNPSVETALLSFPVGARSLDQKLIHIRAAQQAWSIYLQKNGSVHPDDERRSVLQWYLHKRWKAGETDLVELTCSGLSYLSRLETPPEQW